MLITLVVLTSEDVEPIGIGTEVGVIVLAAYEKQGSQKQQRSRNGCDDMLIHNL